MWVSRKLSNTRFPYSLFPWKQCCAFSKKVTKGSIQLSRTRTFRRSHNEVQYTDDERCWWEDSAAGKPKIVNCNQYAISPSALNKHRRKSFTSEKLRLRRKRMENKKTLQMQLKMSSKSPSHYLVKPVFISLESWTTLRPKYLRFFFLHFNDKHSLKEYPKQENKVYLLCKLQQRKFTYQQKRAWKKFVERDAR